MRVEGEREVRSSRRIARERNVGKHLRHQARTGSFETSQAGSCLPCASAVSRSLRIKKQVVLKGYQIGSLCKGKVSRKLATFRRTVPQNDPRREEITCHSNRTCRPTNRIISFDVPHVAAVWLQLDCYRTCVTYLLAHRRTSSTAPRKSCRPHCVITH